MATTPTNTCGGTTTSFINTPQAVDDQFLSAQTGLTEDILKIVYLDVMANDVGGNAKILWSIDNDVNNTGAMGGYIAGDLLTQDTSRAETTSSDTSLNGAKIWITIDGKVGYDATTLSSTFKTQLQSLNVGQFLSDTFTYAIRLANGTLSWATAHVQFAGVNDAAVIAGTTIGTVVEAGGVANAITGTPTATGTLTDTDVDNTANTFTAVPAGTASTGGYGTYAMTTGGVWTYTLNNNNAAVQALNVGGTLTDHITVTTIDGTQQIVTITINGSNDAAVIAGTATASLTETNAVQSTGGTLSATDVDSSSAFTVLSSVAGSNGYGTFSITAAGVWTYNMNSAHNEFVAGTTYTDTVQVTTADGTAQTLTVNILGTNDAPVVDLNGASAGTSATLAYTSGAAATAIAPSGTVTDIDSADFNGGSLTVAFTSNGTANDQLAIQNQGTAVGQIGVSGSNVTYGGVVIGTFSGGTSGTSLVITFNSATATPTAVQALVDDITYSNAASTSITKTLSYTLNDGDGTANGGTSTGTATATISVTDTTSPFAQTPATITKSPTNNDRTITLTFSEALAAGTFTAADLTISGGGTITSVTPVSGSNNTQFTVVVTGVGNPGTSSTITVVAGGYTDLVGNLGLASNAIAIKNPGNQAFPAGVSGEAINLALIDPTSDHSDLIHLTVSGVPAGWTLNQGSRNADGTWSIDTYDPSALSVTSATDFAGAIVLSVNASWTNANGTTSAMQTNDNVEVFAKGSPIFALSGDDHLTGSSGDDLFVLSTPIGYDTINNFDAAHDKIDLVGFAGFASFADVLAHLSQNAAGNALITLASGQSIELVGVSAASLSDSNFAFNVDPVTDNVGSITIGDDAIMPFSGVLNNSGTLTLDGHGYGALLEVIQHGLTLQGGGQVILSDDASNGIFAADASIALTNEDNTISGAGQLGEGQMVLVNQGTIIASGSNALVIDTGANVINNSGTLEATGAGGLVINSSVDNSGTLWANGANITVNGYVTGGSATLGGIAMLELGGNSSVNVSFADAAAQTLQIDGMHQFSGTVSGLGAGDSLDFTAFNNTAAVSYVENVDGLGGVLSITEGADALQINLVGNYIEQDFVTSFDATHGLTVKYDDGLIV